MKQAYITDESQQIPDDVLKKAIERVKLIGFKRELERQARRMIEDTTAIVTALGGHIEWER